MVALLFSRRRWWLTLLVLIAIAVMIGLGIWQIRRLGERRALNEATRAQLSAPPLTLRADALPPGLETMEYRQATVTGEYDAERSVALLNQAWQNRPGVHLLTPLRLPGGSAVLVDRGWLPLDQSAPDKWQPYTVTGSVTVQGVLRASRTTPGLISALRPTALASGRVTAWTTVDLARIGADLPYPLLPIYLQQSPDAARTGLPYAVEPQVDLSDGPHLSYAIQWFSFALVLGIGYPIWLRRTSQ